MDDRLMARSGAEWEGLDRETVRRRRPEYGTDEIAPDRLFAESVPFLVPIPYGR